MCGRNWITRNFFGNNFKRNASLLKACNSRKLRFHLAKQQQMFDQNLFPDFALRIFSKNRLRLFRRNQNFLVYDFWQNNSMAKSSFIFHSCLVFFDSIEQCLIWLWWIFNHFEGKYRGLCLKVCEFDVFPKFHLPNCSKY